MFYPDLPPERPPVELIEYADARFSRSSTALPSPISAAATAGEGVSRSASDLAEDQVVSPPGAGLGQLTLDDLRIEQPNRAARDTIAQTSTELLRLPAQPGSEPASEPAPLLENPLSAPYPVLTPDPPEATPDAAINADQPAAITPGSALQLTSDYQEYDPIRQVVIAQGNVVLQLERSRLQADELRLNVVNRFALAEGNVLLSRGAQVIRGEQAEYSFTQGMGMIRSARGELFIPALESDFANPLERRTGTIRPIYDPINPDRSLEVRNEGSLRLSTDSNTAFGAESTGSGVRQLRFEADRLFFDADGWQAEGVRITNDPFSPPELEFRARTAQLRNISPTQDELTLGRPRIVFDQGLSLPLLRSRFLFSRGSTDPTEDDSSPLPAEIGLDGRDRGGVFLESELIAVTRPGFNFSVAPQFFVNQAITGSNGGFFDLDNFGIATKLAAQLSPRTTLRGRANLSSLDPSKFTDELRANLQAQRFVGSHLLSLEAGYRERLYNGSLGFQDVQSNLGAVILSPAIPLGNQGPTLSYQASAQYITANTDRADLLGTAPEDNLISLGRFQGSASLTKSFQLWQGEPLPPTQFGGLRYTPEPVVPFLQLQTGLRATRTYYTNGDVQDTVAGSIGLVGQVGHLSRNFGDYTRFNISYYQALLGGAESPFTFDRDVDRSVLTLGITQQIYGPFLLGVQTAINLDTGEEVDTSFALEYSRRTYGLLVRYNPSQEVGFVGFRLSNLGWSGETAPFDQPPRRDVEGGIIQREPLQ